MPLRFRSGGKKIGEKNEKQQAVDDDADKCWRKNAPGAVPANAEQADDTESQANEHQRQSDKFDHNGRTRASPKSDQDEDKRSACPARLGGLVRERSGLLRWRRGRRWG